MAAPVQIAPPRPGAGLRLCLPCDLDQVRPLTREARAFLAAKGLREEELMSCELVLAEACNNAIQYATGEGQGQPIEVVVECDDARVQMLVNDHTPGFNLQEKLRLPEDESESGRGMFIIQSLVDDIDYLFGTEFNSLVLTKSRLPVIDFNGRAIEEKVEALTRKLGESEQIIDDMAEELSSCYESLSAIFRCGAELGKTGDLREFSHNLCRDLLLIADADWFVLRVVPRDGGFLTVFTSSTDPLPPLAISTDKVNSYVELKAAFYRKDVWFDATNPLESEDPLCVLKPGSIGLVHPFFFSDNLMGTLTIGKPTDGKPLTAAQANIVHTFADFLAIQIITARLRDEQVNHRLVAHELEIARNIQRALLPKSLPQLPGFDLAGFCESARQVGGDFYDVLQINEHSALLVIADVMGKGVPAAMFAATLRGLLRAAPEMATQPGALLGRVNRLLYDELSNVEMFITAQLVFVDVLSRRIITANAGHCPVLLQSTLRKNISAIAPDGLPLGILPDTTFYDQTADLEARSRLILYTDGLTDAQSSSSECFGHPRLLQWLEKTAARNAAELKESLAAELNTFRGTTPLADDLTFLIFAEAL